MFSNNETEGIIRRNPARYLIPHTVCVQPPRSEFEIAEMYRPKFCAECGEKIIRIHWRPWHSRRFCGACSPRFLKEQLVNAGTAGLVILVVGIALGRAGRSNPPPLIIQRNAPSASPSQSGTNAPAAATEEIYTCGARTKKGTPCSRRVHGPVRCWQHRGMPAMLPQEKLRIKE